MTRPGRRAAPEVDLQVQSQAWDGEPQAENTVRAAIAAAARACPAEGEVSIVLTDDAAIRTLNRDWRNLDKATNVLSFPAPKPAAAAPLLLGDIVIAYETLAREADEEGKPLLHHLAHLAVHGFLHLMGYDHQTDSQADAMERLERDILASMNIADPYRAHETGPA
ncbi:MAG TPA: rRNA maturation RNase YbeY [Pseudolabrys sp.]|nr:rRNA maturation RNase YbeY [Pseudolabrys sp.]